MSPYNKMSHIYNPANQSYEELLESFVVRKKEFQKIFNELKCDNLESSPQHFLIEGQRGTGKTSLLLRLRYEIENNKELDNLIAVQFAEEQYNIFDLSRIWEKSAEALEEVEGFESLSDELDKRSDDDDYMQECFFIFEKYLIKNKKRLVLLLDNFGDILDKLSDIEEKRLRDIFHTSSYIQLIASSSRALEHTYMHDKAFFEFFDILRLEGLNKEETNMLLMQLSKSTNRDISDILEKQKSRVETIRRLTSGIPRTIVLLFEIFLDNSANVFEDLELILDRVTPLYKHRMDDLATKQQAIMDTIALNWDGITSKEIVQGLKKRGYDTKSVSSLLIVLEKNDLVLSKKIDKKNKIYMVKERFFNIWYLMRYGRKKNKSQVQWLIRFLEEWCDDSELEGMRRNHIRNTKEGRISPKGAFYMGEALACVIKDHALQHELLQATKDSLKRMGNDMSKNMSLSDLELQLKALDYYGNKKYKLALKIFEKVQHKNTLTHIMIAWIYQIEYKDFDNSIKYYKMGVKEDNTWAMHDLALLYQIEYKDFDNAVKYYQMAINKGDTNSMNDLTYLYFKQNIKKSESLKMIKESIGIENHNISLHSLSLMLLWNDEYQESINNIKDLINNFSYTDFMDDMTEYFIFLIAKKQYHLTYNLFEEFPDLKIQFKPIYYALMGFLKDEHFKEYLKQGEELEETIKEILKKVEQMSDKYNS